MVQGGGGGSERPSIIWHVDMPVAAREVVVERGCIIAEGLGLRRAGCEPPAQGEDEAKAGIRWALA